MHAFQARAASADGFSSNSGRVFCVSRNWVCMFFRDLGWLSSKSGPSVPRAGRSRRGRPPRAVSRRIPGGSWPASFLISLFKFLAIWGWFSSNSGPLCAACKALAPRAPSAGGFSSNSGRGEKLEARLENAVGEIHCIPDSGRCILSWRGSTPRSRFSCFSGRLGVYQGGCPAPTLYTEGVFSDLFLLGCFFPGGFRRAWKALIF